MAIVGFPRDLLLKPLRERLGYFQSHTLAHPLLLEAKEKLMAAIYESEPNSLVFVFGPSGVGKTTLRLRAEQLIVADLQAELHEDLGRIPVVSVEATAPESGNFSWSDHFKRVLLAMNDPLVQHKRNLDNVIAASRSKPTTADYRHAVEQALHYRRPVAVMIDEAQHFSKMASGRRLLDQLDVIKSLANQTRTVHILFGTYDLLAFRNLNGQLSRRSVDVHFRRYRADSHADQQIFVNILRSFAHHLPLQETPDLAVYWQLLYERSIGSVGILKQWLLRSLHSALRRNEPTITKDNLESHALSVAQCEILLSEAVDGETRLKEKEQARSRLMELLGLPVGDGSSLTSKRHDKATIVSNRRPGRRHPRRDPIGERNSVTSI